MHCLPGLTAPMLKPLFLVKSVISLAILSLLSMNVAHGSDEFDAGLRNIDSQKSLPIREQIDQVDPHSGNLLVRHVDLRWKGNGGLDIVINRNYDLRSASAGPQTAISKSFRWGALGAGWAMIVAPRWAEYRAMPTNGGRLVTHLSRLCTNEVSSFNTLAEYGPFIELPSGDREALISLGNGRAITKGNWRAECIANKISISSPDGLIYDLGDISLATGAQDGPAIMFAVTIVLPARRVTDPSGNWLAFDYARAGPPTPLVANSPTHIASSDGRQVDFSYDQATGRLRSMQDNTGRTWLYEQSQGSSVEMNLVSVTSPGNETWRYSYAAGPYQGKTSAENAKSMKLETLTYPEGGTVRFEVEPFEYTWFGSNLHGSVSGPRIRQRTTSDGGSWSYAYTHGGIGEYDVTTVTGPSGVTTYKHMGTGYVVSPQNYAYVDNLWRFGQLMEKSDDDGNIETYIWGRREISSNPVRVYGPELVWDQKTWAADLVERKIIRDGLPFTTRFSQHDSYGRPGTIEEVGPSGETRTTTNTYYTDADRWIINRLKNESTAAGTTTREFDASGRVVLTVRNGVPTSHAYDGQGNIARTTFPRGLEWTFADYKRGIPQTERRPEGINIARIVSDAGNIESETNGAGKTSTFRFDGMNRPTEIHPPIGAATTIVYGPNSKTSNRGGLVETIEYDGFGRTASVTLGGIRTAYRYDALGRTKFKSDPDSANGVSYDYDRLNRINHVNYADSTSQTFSYSGVQKLAYDSRGSLTTYSYRSYGNPDEKILMSVTSPEPAANISIGRRADDLVGFITQAGVTRTYDYNANKYLVSVNNPETGTTVFGRDPAGNMTSRSVGASGDTIYKFDGQNRLTSVTYPGATPAVVKTYTRTNKLETVNSSAANRSYQYDDNDNLIGETIKIDALSFSIGYSYNGNDQLSSMTYPQSGRVVAFSPDILGRPTSVSGYVTSIAYWPSGQIGQIDYANGTVTKYGQNSRLWPESFATRFGSAAYLDSSYLYDGMGNLTSITDSVDAAFNRTMGFDGLNRLTIASGPWGVGSIAYDGGGNISQQTFGAYNIQYRFDGSNRLSGVSGALSTSFTYDASGNIASGYGSTYSYDGAPNLRCINCANSMLKVENGYDGLNQRIWTSKDGIKRYEIFGSSGSKLIEYAPQRAERLTEYIYLGGKRIAQSVSK
jgi:YD repeat-containing protein